jgi:hypothetical protein
MTSKEYVIWLKGFVEACHEYAPTPKQWDALKDKLAEVNDTIGTPIGPGIGVPNIQQFPTWQHPHHVDPYNPYKITAQPGTTLTVSSGSGGTIIATPGYGSITYANPPFGFGSTSTTYGYPSGSAWSYTNNKPHNED